MNDITLPPLNRLQAGGMTSKPAYLISLESSGKVKTIRYFITLDKPELLNGFVQAKGFYEDSAEEEIIKKFSDLLTNVKRELICEMMFPWHKICSIRSLIFRAK